MFLARTTNGKWMLLNKKPVVGNTPTHKKKRQGGFTTSRPQLVDSAKKTKDAGWPFKLSQKALDMMLIEELDGYRLGPGEYVEGDMIYEINSPTPNFYLFMHRGKPCLVSQEPDWILDQWVPKAGEQCYIRMCDQYVRDVYYLNKVEGVIPVMVTIVLKDSKVKLL
jgi:hypothetical protein